MKKHKSKKIYVTGHNGMVGRSVCNQLRKKNFEKIITINKKKLDLENKSDVSNFFKKKKPDIVIHCAAMVGGILYNNNDKLNFLTKNLNINKNIIEACFNNNVQTLIFLGSSCVYPNDIKRKIKEEDLLSSNLEITNEAYALSKIIGLRLCDYYNEKYGTDYRCVMPCNLFGPGDNYDLKKSHVIPALIKKIDHAKRKDKKNIEVWGNGSPRREFLYVEDLAKILVDILLCSKSNFQRHSYRSIINVGSKHEFAISQLVMKIAETLRHKVEINYVKRNLNGTKRKKLDLKNLNKLLGKNIKYHSFSDSILKTYNDYLNK